MRDKLRSIVLAAAVSFGAGEASAQATDSPPAALEPIAGWQLDYADNSCVLFRSFGSEDDPVHLELRQYAPDIPFYGTVVRRAEFAAAPAPHFRFVGTDAGSVRGASDAIELDDGFRGARMKVYVGNPRLPSPLVAEHRERDAHEASLTQLSITGVYSEDLLLNVGAMHGPLSAMRDCLSELIGHWGLDGEAHRTLSSSADYIARRSDFGNFRRRMPADVLELFEAGSLPMRLTIDADGRPSACTRLMTQGTDEQIATGCALVMEYFRYDAARDSEGDLIASYAVEGIATIRIIASPHQ